MTVKNSFGSQGTTQLPIVAPAVETVTIDEPPGRTGTPSLEATYYPDESAPLVKVQEIEADFRPLYQDVWWAIAFLLHLGIMLYLGVAYGSFGVDKLNRLNVTDDTNVHVDKASLAKTQELVNDLEEYLDVYPQRIVEYLVLPGVLLAFLYTYVWTAFIIRTCPSVMVRACLLGSIAWTVFITLSIAMTSTSLFGYVGSAAMLGVATYYVCIVWKLIPFAAINLSLSLKAISANWGLYLVGFVFSVVGFLWTAFWLYATIGLLNYQLEEYNENHSASRTKSSSTNAYDDDSYDPEGGPQNVTLALLLVSLYWTTRVLLNTVQVTVAGVMGTWCYDKQDASSCCSPAVMSSLQRSVTYSFGSICFGSLLQALITVLRIMVEQARSQRNEQNDNGCGTILLCILECIVRLLEDVIDYFNQWAYVYVGIYGYSYLESGKKVIELFRARGWTSLVTNNLVGYVLGFTTFTVAIFTGLSAMAIETCANRKYGWGSNSYVLGPLPGHGFVAFGLGFVIGLVVSSVMMNVIQGAVNTLIVCFADDPGKLEDNHPEEARRMAEAWISVFPDSGVRAPQYSVVV